MAAATNDVIGGSGGSGIHHSLNTINNNNGVPSSQNLSTPSMINGGGGGNKHENSINANGNYSIKSSSSATIDNGIRNSTEEIHSMIDQDSGGDAASAIGLRMNNGGGGVDGTFGNTRRSSKSPNSYFNDLPDRRNHNPRIINEHDEDDDELGPLPPKWEKAYTDNGEVYFIDNNSGTSHWLDPRLSKFQKKSLEDCMDDELPYGWEKIHDPQYGTYFIDHVNRRTQYENPVLQAKRRAEQSTQIMGSGSKMDIPKSIFTRDPAELNGEKITTTLLKSSRGLGFTIVGGDDNIEEFLQIKSIVPNGPAWLDGKLQMGDILVYVNDICVLGFTHHEMVNVFQSIMPGETVTLEVCRGYPLPFDPNDPNADIVTTIAVDGISADPEKSRILMDLNMDGNYNFLDKSDSINESGGAGGGKMLSPSGGPDMNNSGTQKNPLYKIRYGTDELNRIVVDKPEILSISIIKGNMGFGFTIADSSHGQKVKKILDRNCCKNLIEGDVLLSINSIGVKNMSHSDVVQVLKDCPKGQEALLRIQRVPHYSTVNLAAKTSNKLKRAANMGGGFGSKDPILYRSKTPTADLYSTQPKEILPTRPKTPLVDIRDPNNKSGLSASHDELDRTVGGGGGQIDDKNDELKGMSDTKSNNSLHEQDSITNDIPSMDPFPKFVTHLTERLAQTTIATDQSNNIYHNTANRHHGGVGGPYVSASQSDLNNYVQPHQMKNDYYNNYNSSGGYAELNGNSSGWNGGGVGNVYSPGSIMAPVPTYHQDTCYCFECQEYHRQHQEFMMLQQEQQHFQQQQQSYMSAGGGYPSQHSKYKMLDRRKMGFVPLETLSFPSPTQQHQYWKYGHHPSSVGGSMDVGQPMMATDEEYSLSEVTLDRQTLGFGFRIVGGTEEGSQVTVGHIVAGGSADKDPRIQTGDEILSIDGVNVVGGSHHRAVQLMGQAALRGQVTMILRRRSRQILCYPYDVIVSRNDNDGFGFVIISSTNQYYGSTIGKLIAGSPADRCGEIKVGDRIVAVNHIDITGMSHGDVVNLIKDSGMHVCLTIGNPRDPQEMNPPSQSGMPGGSGGVGGGVIGVNKNETYLDLRYQMNSQPQL